MLCSRFLVVMNWSSTGYVGSQFCLFTHCNVVQYSRSEMESMICHIINIYFPEIVIERGKAC